MPPRACRPVPLFGREGRAAFARTVPRRAGGGGCVCVWGGAGKGGRCMRQDKRANTRRRGPWPPADKPLTATMSGRARRPRRS